MKGYSTRDIRESFPMRRTLESSEKQVDFLSGKQWEPLLIVGNENTLEEGKIFYRSDDVEAVLNL